MTQNQIGLKSQNTQTRKSDLTMASLLVTNFKLFALSYNVNVVLVPQNLLYSNFKNAMA